MTFCVGCLKGSLYLVVQKKSKRQLSKNIFPPSVNLLNEAENQKMLEEKHSNRKKSIL
jgi:hypothetical protein